MATFAVIIAAAGRSTRFNDKAYKKPFIQLNQKPVWLYSVERFQNRRDVKQTVVVISPDDQEDFMSRFGANVAVLGIDVVLGGEERSDSVRNALKKVDPGIDFVAIHDAARPCISDDDIQSVFEAAKDSGAAILATPVVSTIKRIDPATQHIIETVDRSSLWQAQTPQVFKRRTLDEVYSNIGDLKPTDEAQLFEQFGHPVSIVAGSPTNIKITTKQDLRLASSCLKSAPKSNFDAPIHPFADDNLFR